MKTLNKNRIDFAQQEQKRDTSGGVMRHPFPKYDCPTTPRAILHLQAKQARERDLLHHEAITLQIASVTAIKRGPQ